MYDFKGKNGEGRERVCVYIQLDKSVGVKDAKQQSDLDKNGILVSACDCDTFGSENKGLCESITDELLGTVAGRCVCKRFVKGDRCDSCVDNYWNLDENNPDGCEGKL